MKSAQSSNSVKKALKQVSYKAHEQPVEHLAVSQLDPLHCDSDMAQLPSWNEEGDIAAIVSAVERNTPSPTSIREMTEQEARAALRDLGMLLASIKRHGCEPESVVPTVIPAMLALGTRSQMVPRETIMHYGVWNPDGERQRCFTHLHDEIQVIQGTKMAIPGLERAIFALAELHQCSPLSLDFVDYAALAQTNIDAMVKAIVFAIVNVNPRVFAVDLRPYYDPLTIDNTEYMGAGAVQLPLFVFDHLLWSSDCTDATLHAFKEEMIQYCTPVFRELFARFSNAPSLVQLLHDAIQHNDSSSPQLHQSIQAVNGLFDVLIRFRTPHKSLAYRAFSHRDDIAVGSGGYRPTVLDHILDLTLQARNNLRKTLKAKGFP